MERERKGRVIAATVKVRQLAELRAMVDRVAVFAITQNIPLDQYDSGLNVLEARELLDALESAARHLGHPIEPVLTVGQLD